MNPITFFTNLFILVLLWAPYLRDYVKEQRERFSWILTYPLISSLLYLPLSRGSFRYISYSIPFLVIKCKPSKKKLTYVLLVSAALHILFFIHFLGLSSFFRVGLHLGNARVAVADAGIMGFMARGYVKDILGLSSPDVIPYLRSGNFSGLCSHLLNTGIEKIALSSDPISLSLLRQCRSLCRVDGMFHYAPIVYKNATIYLLTCGST